MIGKWWALRRSCDGWQWMVSFAVLLTKQQELWRTYIRALPVDPEECVNAVPMLSERTPQRGVRNMFLQSKHVPLWVIQPQGGEGGRGGWAYSFRRNESWPHFAFCRVIVKASPLKSGGHASTCFRGWTVWTCCRCHRIPNLGKLQRHRALVAAEGTLQMIASAFCF